jgi:hypothetical protein
MTSPPPSSGSPQYDRASAEAAYLAMRDRLRLNFRVAVWTNTIAAAVLISGVVAAAATVMLGEYEAASIFGGLSLVDVLYGVTQKPWRQLWIANNRIALTEAIWIAHTESKEVDPDPYARLWRLREANLWISRMATVSRDDFETAVEELKTLHEAESTAALALARLEIEADAEGLITAHEGLDRIEAGGGTLDEYVE